MQNKYQQRYSQPQHLPPHRLKTHSITPPNQTHHEDIITQPFPSAVITRCALQLTTRLNTFENRMDALETILLYGRPETRTIDTLTACRIGGVKKRRRSRRNVSALMLEDIHDERLAQDGYQQSRSTQGSRTNRNDSTYGQHRVESFGEDWVGGMGLDVEDTTMDFDDEVRNTSSEQIRTQGLSTPPLSRRLRPRTGIVTAKQQYQNLVHRSTRPTRNTSSYSASPGLETLPQHNSVSNKTNDSSSIGHSLTEDLLRSSQSSDCPTLVIDEFIRDLVLLPTQFQIPILKDEKHPTLPQIQTATQQAQNQTQTQSNYRLKFINFSKPLPPRKPLAQIQAPISEPIQTRKPTPYHHLPPPTKHLETTHLRTLSSATIISTSTTTTSTAITTCSSTPSSSITSRTLSSISSVDYPASDDEEEEQLEVPPVEIGCIVEDFQTEFLSMQERKQERVLSESELKTAIELWSFDVGVRFRV